MKFGKLLLVALGVLVLIPAAASAQSQFAGNVQDDTGGALTRGDPPLSDLRVLLRQGRLTLQDMSEQDLRTRACRHGWTFACTGGAQ